jgi:hypothetical protein
MFSANLIAQSAADVWHIEINPESDRLLVKKLTGDFDNGLGAVLIGERSSASFLSKKSREGISGLFQRYRPRTDSCTAANGTA